ncbi:hypothetical protein PAMP_000559 [Pampus punctatissimus]
MFRQRIPLTQIVFATVLGFCGGIYIYKPCFQPELKPSGQQNQDVPKEQNKTEGNNSSL